jgi:hypothetical protein
MPRVGFEPTTPVFKQAKTVHALDRKATVIGSLVTLQFLKNIYECISCCGKKLPLLL